MRELATHWSSLNIWYPLPWTICYKKCSLFICTEQILIITKTACWNISYLCINLVASYDGLCRLNSVSFTLQFLIEVAFCAVGHPLMRDIWQIKHTVQYMMLKSHFIIGAFPDHCGLLSRYWGLNRKFSFPLAPVFCKISLEDMQVPPSWPQGRCG